MGFDMNYKIKVESEAKSKEAQELFLNLGLDDVGDCSGMEWIASDHIAFSGYDSKTMNNFTFVKFKEITLPELRDLVVLKRNSVEDATHTDQDNWKWYVGADAYVWQAGNAQQLKQWDKSGLYMVDLKPIEKKEMKEYLIKINGAYKLCNLLEDDVTDEYIEIPEGCNIITCQNRMGSLVYFHWKSLDSDEFFLKDEKIWSNNFNETLSDFVEKNEGDVKIIWKRSESPNDKLASAEQYRQAEVLPFIDDEPKNVEQGSIEQTLAQRQSQYGCFEDVAFVTQGMIELMRKCNYDKMPASHQMALSMICSKMARIVNGDFNHKDSWHDIGGYARLIEDEIFDETEMPF